MSFLYDYDPKNIDAGDVAEYNSMTYDEFESLPTAKQDELMQEYIQEAEERYIDRQIEYARGY